MSSRRVSDEQLLGSIAFVGVVAFFLSKAAVHGATKPSTAAPAGKLLLPVVGLFLAAELAEQLELR